MILLFHYSGHAFDPLLTGHFGGPVLRRVLTGAAEFGGVSTRLLRLHLQLMVVLQLQLLLLLRLLQLVLLLLLLLLLLQVDTGPVVIGPGGRGLRHRFLGRGAEMLPTEHRGQRNGPGHEVFGRAHRRVVVEPFQVHQVTEASGRTLGTQHNIRSVVFS